MARKGRKVVHTYELKYLDKWRALMEQPEPPPKPKTNPNVNQLWTWDTLEDVEVTDFKTKK